MGNSWTVFSKYVQPFPWLDTKQYSVLLFSLSSFSSSKPTQCVRHCPLCSAALHTEAPQFITCQLCVNSCTLSVREPLGTIHSFPASLSLVPKSPAEIPGRKLKWNKIGVIQSRCRKITAAVSGLWLFCPAGLSSSVEEGKLPSLHCHLMSQLVMGFSWAYQDIKSILW